MEGIDGHDDKDVSGIRGWAASVISRSVTGLQREKDKQEIVDWLHHSKTIFDWDGSNKEKAKAIYNSMDGKALPSVFVNSISDAVKNYRNAPIPTALKVAIPTTFLATPFLWGTGVGVAAFGGAVGIPVLLLVFLGSAGIGAVLEDIARTPSGAIPLSVAVLETIARDDMARRTTAAMKEAMRTEPARPHRAHMPAGDIEIREKLMSMDPFDFEAHVMSFFEREGIRTWVTKKSNDLGVDGFVDSPDGLIVVQCKKYSHDNLVGAPAIQQFKGVIEENEAYRGFIVTTSWFSSPAQASAVKSDRLSLVDGDALVGWHKREGFCALPN